MSSVPEADPADLSLSNLDPDLDLGRGPTIDSSDEFPLPSFDDLGDTGIAADVLFPLEGEPTAEDVPAAEGPNDQETVEFSKDSAEKDSHTEPDSKKDEESTPAVASNPPNDSELGRFAVGTDEGLDDLDLDAKPVPILPSITFDMEPEESLDADYFEAGLEGNSRGSTPSSPPPKAPKAPSPRGGAEPTRQVAASPVASLGTSEEQSEKASSADSSVPDFSKPSSSGSGLTTPGPPQASLETKSSKQTADESSIDEIFFGHAQAPEKSEAKTKGPVRREDWVEEVPVEQYVRRVKVKRRSGRKLKVRPWVPAAGVAVLAAAFLVSTPVFQKMHETELSAPVLVVASNPKGEVYSGDQLLGNTPLALSAEQAADPDLEVRKNGYVATKVVVAEGVGAGDKPVGKFFPSLQVEPIKLAWSGLPEGSTVWWNGKKVEPSSLGQALPGVYSLKVKPESGPSISTKVTLEPRSGAEGPFSVGAEVSRAFALQPKANIALKLPDEKSQVKALGVTVSSLDKKQPFSSKVQLSSSTPAEVALPGPGKYKLSFSGDETFKPSSQEVELPEGETTDVSLALTKRPPKPVAPNRPTYRPAQPTYRPTYRPPPRRPYQGGGGGGGRIAPPAF